MSKHTPGPLRIDSGMHADMAGSSSLACSTCGAEQTPTQTEKDPLMYTWDFKTLECDGCKELREGWPQEVAVTRWEDSQR